MADSPPNRSRATDRTSASLLEQVRQNDTIAWQRFVDIYSPMIYFWCQKKRFARPRKIPDIFQDVLHSIAKNLTTYKPTASGSFRGWLRTVTRNKINDHYRRVGRVPQSVGGTEAHLQFRALADRGDEVCSAEKAVICGALKTALTNIEPHFQQQTWQAFWKVVVDGRTTADVAAELSLRPGTVRVAKSRVFKTAAL